MKGDKTITFSSQERAIIRDALEWVGSDKDAQTEFPLFDELSDLVDRLELIR